MNLKPNNNENETLEHYMAKETMSNFNDSSIEAFTNYGNGNGNGNGNNLAQIVTDEQFVKPKKKAKKKKNNRNTRNMVRQPMPQQQFLPQEFENSAELSSDELIGSYDEKKGKRFKIDGYLEEFALSKSEADDLIMNARNIIFK